MILFFIIYLRIFSIYLHVNYEKEDREWSQRIIEWIDERFQQIQNLVDPSPFVAALLILTLRYKVKIKTEKYIELLEEKGHLYLAIHLGQSTDKANIGKVERKIINRKRKISEIFKNWDMNENLAISPINEDPEIINKMPDV